MPRDDFGCDSHRLAPMATLLVNDPRTMRRVSTRDLVLQGPIRRAVLLLAGPVIAGEAAHAAFHLVDVAIVGPLGSWATAAVMTSMFTLWLAFALSNLVTTGLGAHVARAVGAGDLEHAGHVSAQAAWLCVMLGIPVAIAGSFAARPIFDLLGTDPRVAEAGSAYLRVIVLGLPIAFLYNAAGAVMRACGNTRVPLLVNASTLAANAALAPFLVYGWGPFPRLGVPGSALATVAAMTLTGGAYAVLALRRHPDLPVRFASLSRPDRRMLLELARVGLPYCAVGALFSLVYLWYAHVASAFGAAALALVGIGNRLESVTYLTGDGFAVASTTFVGQNLGAGNPERAERGAWTAARIMSAFGAAVGLVFLAAPDLLLLAFTRDPDALAIGAPYVRILALCQVFTGLEGVIGGAFAGAGDTVPPMLVHVVFAVLRIPLASWACFSLGLGVLGIAWTMTLTCVVRASILAWWFSRGRWKSARLGMRPPVPAAEDPELRGW